MCLADLRESSDDPPVLSGQSWGRDGHPGLLSAPLCVDKRATLLRVGSPRQNHVCEAGSSIAMVTLVDHKAVLRNILLVDAISILREGNKQSL